MSKPIIFDLKNKKTLKSISLSYEKELQKNIEENMEEIFSIRFLKSEHIFQDSVLGNGRIDSLGIDEQNRPVIFEYKLKQNENVINQALYYMNWLKDHKAEFEMIVLDKLGTKIKTKIEWNPRSICIANDFNRFDISAVKQMKVDVLLIKYYIYGENKNLIAFESINSTSNEVNLANDNNINYLNNEDKSKDYSIDYFKSAYDQLSNEQKEFIDWICESIEIIGEDVSISTLTTYRAFRRIKTFASLIIRKRGNCFIYLPIDYLDDMKNFGNISNKKDVGHWGIGNIEIEISTKEDFHKVYDFIKKSYDNN